MRWKEREISEESYRLVATSPASSLKFTFGRLGIFLQIASQIISNQLVEFEISATAYIMQQREEQVPNHEHFLDEEGELYGPGIVD